MKVYVVKHAMTKGIYLANADMVDENTIKVRPANGERPYYLHGKEWCTDKDTALAQAEQMRKREISVLERRIEKIKNIDFERNLK